MRFRFVIVLLAAISVAHAQTAQGNQNPDLQAFVNQLASTRKAIADSYIRWTEATKKKDVDAVVKLYTDDATILPDEGEPVSRKDALRAFYTEWYASQGKLVDLKFENIDSVQTGDWLIDSTKYSGVWIKDGKEVAFRGKRLVVWKREFQGSWKILRDTWNRSRMPNDGH